VKIRSRSVACLTRGQLIPAAIAAVFLTVFTACSNTPETGSIPAQSDILVAAASDLRFAFTEVGERFTESTGQEVVFTFGSSGQLREQVINGAPFDVFASANEQFVQDVIAAERGWQDTSRHYASGRIVLRARDGLAMPNALSDLVRPNFARIAIANPAHAPYGIAAKEALESAGVFASVKDKLIFGENVSDTLRLVETGNVDVAIVALSLVINDQKPYVLVDENLHTPLRQTLVVTRTGKNEEGARRFVEFLLNPEIAQLMETYGFVVPIGEES